MDRLEQAERRAELLATVPGSYLNLKEVAKSFAWACGEIRRLTEEQQAMWQLRDECVARVKELTEALEQIAALSSFVSPAQGGSVVKSPGIARAVLAGGQEKATTRANQGG